MSDADYVGVMRVLRVLEPVDAKLNTIQNGENDNLPQLDCLTLTALLSTSGLPSFVKLELSQRARTVWKGWQMDPNDIEFVRKRNGDRRRIGGGQVYLARMKLRDGEGNIIEGKYTEVAVKQLVVKRSCANQVFLQFMREVFLQTQAQHPCVVRTFGGYWPSPEEVEDEDDAIEPFIVMERMTHNLRDVQSKGLLKSAESKYRVLIDIAHAIEHLHDYEIVHRDIKPENVLLRVVDGKIIGKVKLCDFGVSRKTEARRFMTPTTEFFTSPSGTSLYMPPEAFNNSARDSCNTPHDIWSYGVLMFELIDPTFEPTILTSFNRLYVNAARAEFAKKVAEKAAESTKHIIRDWSLEKIMASCLSLDPTLRPRIKDLLTWINSMGPDNIHNVSNGTDPGLNMAIMPGMPNIPGIRTGNNLNLGMNMNMGNKVNLKIGNNGTGDSPGNSGIGTNDVLGSAGASGQRIWQGNLHVRGHVNGMVVPCVAMRYPIAARLPVRDASGWPQQIHCDSSKLKQCPSVFQFINEPTSQWYVRFAPIDNDGKIVRLVRVLVQRQLAFEIECAEGTAGHGTLYLGGMALPLHGHSLVGMFRPVGETITDLMKYI